jgi:thiol-disulfide isomerase/thioredoxin
MIRSGWIIALALVALALLPTAAVAAPAEVSIDLLVERGRAARDEGRVGDVAIAARQALQIDSADWRATDLALWASEAQGLDWLSDHDLRQQPTGPEATLVWLASMASRGQPSPPRLEDAALAVEPALATYMLARLEHQAGSDERAVGMLSRAELPEAAALRIELLLALGQDRAAVDAARHAGEVEIERPDALLGLFAPGQVSGVVDRQRTRTLRRIAREAPKADVLWLYRARRLALRAREVELVDAIDSRLEQAGEPAMTGRLPSNPAMHAALANVLARSDAAELPVMNTLDTQQVGMRLAMLLADAGRTPDAARIWQETRARADSTDLAAAHARYLLHEGERDRAEEVAWEALLLASMGDEVDRGWTDRARQAAGLATAWGTLAETLQDTRPDLSRALLRLAGVVGGVGGTGPRAQGAGSLISRYGAVGEAAGSTATSPIDHALEGVRWQLAALGPADQHRAGEDAIVIASVKPEGEEFDAVWRARFSVALELAVGPESSTQPIGHQLPMLATAALLAAGPQLHVRRAHVLAAMGNTEGAVVALSIAATGGLDVGPEIERLWPSPPWEELAMAAYARWQRTAEIAPARSQGPTAAVGDPIGDKAVEIDGVMVQLADLAGEPVVLAFWASWCAPCMLELPELAELARDEDVDPINIIAVSVDSQESAFRKTARRPDLAGLQMTWSPPLGAELGVSVLPTTWVVGPDGVLAERHMGYQRGWARTLQREIRERWHR